MDWKQLIQAVGPVALGMATKGQHGAVLRGYMSEQDRIADEQRQQQQETQRRRQVGASMSMELMGRLQQETDPVRFEQLRSTITKHADAYGIDPNEFAAMPLPDGSADKLKELSQILDGLSRSGYNPDDLAESGAAVKLKNGQTIQVADALRLTQTRPVDASGAMVPAPKRADANASTDYGRFLSRYAKDKGTKVDALTAAEELEARKLFNTIDDRATPAPKLTPAEAQLADLVDIWKMSHPGQEPPASVRAQLRRQATRDIGTADDSQPSEQLVQVTEVDPETGELVTKLVPRVAGEVGRRPQAKKDPTQAEYTTAGYAGRIEQAEGILGPVSKDIAGMNVLSYGAQSNLPSAAQSATFQSFDQASRNFINAVLRRESGAAIAPSEFDSARKQYLPQPGDTPRTLAQKKANRDLVVANMKRASGQAYQPPPTLDVPGSSAQSDSSTVEEWVRDSSGRLVKKGGR